MMKWIAACALVTAGTLAHAGETKVHNVDFPSERYGERAAEITVESDNSEVECVAYRDGVPVGSGSGYTTAGIANVTVSVTKRAGAFTVKCS